MGRYFGIAAVDLVVQGKYGSLVCLCDGNLGYKPLSEIYGKLNLVDPDRQYDKDRYNGRRTFFYPDCKTKK
jgi:6-phosphofructokinase 1